MAQSEVIRAAGIMGTQHRSKQIHFEGIGSGSSHFTGEMEPRNCFCIHCGTSEVAVRAVGGSDAPD